MLKLSDLITIKFNNNNFFFIKRNDISCKRFIHKIVNNLCSINNIKNKRRKLVSIVLLTRKKASHI